jgi:MSHA pilin protein MshD
MSTSFPRRQQGLSLIELIMFMVIMGVAAASILQVMNLSTKASADPIMRKQALLIAEGLMEEVQTARYTFCDPSDANASSAAHAAIAAADCATTIEAVGQEQAGNRPYDNINDYVNSYNSAQPAFNNAGGVLVDASNTQMGSNLFSATLTLNPVVVLGPATPANLQISSTAAPATQDAMRITVAVSYPGGSVTLDGYRTRYAPTSIP